MKKGKVLIVSCRADLHADFLQAKMRDLNIRVERFNSDDLENQLAVTYRSETGHTVWRRENEEKTIMFRTDEISSVWLRKPFPTKFDLIGKKTEVAFASRESDAYLADLCFCLTETGCKWVNRIDANRQADNKLRQLRLARDLGLRVPKTIVSNDPGDVVIFAKELGAKGLIYKTLTYPFIEATKTTYQSVYTTMIELTPETTNAIRPVPCLIQEYVEKAFELRTVVIGEQVFTAKILSQDHVVTKVDWRKGQGEVELKQELVSIEPSVEKFCIKMVKQLGLTFGAIDMIVTPEGETVFLEINPNGQWAWMEIALGAHISDALIGELTS